MLHIECLRNLFHIGAQRTVIKTFFFLMVSIFLLFFLTADNKSISWNFFYWRFEYLVAEHFFLSKEI